MFFYLTMHSTHFIYGYMVRSWSTHVGGSCTCSRRSSDWPDFLARLRPVLNLLLVRY